MRIEYLEELRGVLDADRREPLAGHVHRVMVQAHERIAVAAGQRGIERTSSAWLMRPPARCARSCRPARCATRRGRRDRRPGTAASRAHGAALADRRDCPGRSSTGLPKPPSSAREMRIALGLIVDDVAAAQQRIGDCAAGRCVPQHALQRRERLARRAACPAGSRAGAGLEICSNRTSVVIGRMLRARARRPSEAHQARQMHGRRDASDAALKSHAGLRPDVKTAQCLRRRRQLTKSSARA